MKFFKEIRGTRDFAFCTNRQRDAVASLIEWLSQNIVHHNPGFEFLGHWKSWEDGIAIWRGGED